jgi:colanic acid/amylovoran biosynthesis glycosyltransferase
MTSDHPGPTIVLLTRDYPFGGGEAFVQDEVSRLARCGRLVVLPAYDAGGGAARAVPEGVTVDRRLVETSIFSALRPRILRALFPAAVREIRARPDLLRSIATMHRFAGYLVRAGRLLSWVDGARRRGETPARVMAFWSNAEAFGMALAARSDASIMLVSRSHRFDVWDDENPGDYLPFRGEIARHSHRLLPSSRMAAEHLRRTLPVDPEHVIVAPLGVEPPFEPDPRRGERDEVLVVSCSTAAVVKRLPLVASAIAAAAAATPSRRWRWAHLGGGGDQIEAALRSGPANLEVELPGWLSRESIYRFHRDRQPDCFVNLSSSEGVPLSIMEALSMRVPVVATAAGGTGEMVDDSVGALLPVEVDAAIAGQAIRRVVEAGEPMREAARRRYEVEASTAVAMSALEEGVPEFLQPPVD